MNSGRFIISLDFELFWGVRDHRTLEQYGANVLGVRKAIPAMLEVFKEYGVHATWATVGFLFFDDKRSLSASCPGHKPAYTNKALSPYDEVLTIGENEKDDLYHFGKSLIQLIRSYPGQEISSHTFSHYYCVEPGQDEHTFRADMQAAIHAADKLGVQLKSLVFPRNQARDEYLKCCEELGIKCYRGTQKSWFHRDGSREGEGQLTRAFRLLDSYVNISGHNSYRAATGNGLVNLPASQFLRPFSPKLAWADPLRKRRIRKGIEHAAQNGEIYHLWWHPHNFGVNLESNLKILRGLLDCFAEMRAKHGMESLTMSEMAEKACHA
jgi:peptidoglycan/xylan/chitin deacetylase (PgdA/CDA1 family)